MELKAEAEDARLLYTTQSDVFSFGNSALLICYFATNKILLTHHFRSSVVGNLRFGKRFNGYLYDNLVQMSGRENKK